MFNVAIIRLKDLIKYLITIIVIISAIYVLIRYFFNNINFKPESLDLEETISNFVAISIENAVDMQIPVISRIEEQQNNTNEEIIDENEDVKYTEFQIYATILGMELDIINIEATNSNNIEENENTENNDEVLKETEEEKDDDKDEETEDTDELGLANTDVTVEVVTENPLSDSSTDEYNGVKIKNETDYELTKKTLNPDSLEIDSSNIIIFHTHTCESYTSSKLYSYTPTGNYRTTDLDYSVARVGEEFADYLTEYGFNTIHDETYHDYPSYSGSYTRSLETVSSLLETTDADIVIDLHRDAVGSYSSYAPTVKIGDDYCAQIMFVIGTNGGGLYHPNWKSNLQFAIKVQEVANSIYPGLFKTIILRNSRYNQHLASAACIIEVGATGNTLEQCLNSMKYLAYVFNSTFN